LENFAYLEQSQNGLRGCSIKKLAIERNAFDLPSLRESKEGR